MVFASAAWVDEPVVKAQTNPTSATHDATNRTDHVTAVAPSGARCGLSCGLLGGLLGGVFGKLLCELLGGKTYSLLYVEQPI